MNTTCRKVFVVEDDSVAREAVAAILRGHGFDVQTAPDGQAALHLMSSGPPPDVIVLDMMMPNVDGWQFLRKFNQLDPHPRPWIIIASGAPAIGREWAADVGCGGFLRKPIDADELVDEMRRCVSQTVEMPLV